VCDRETNPGSSDSFTAAGLDNGTKYNFSAFTYDESGNYSETAHVTATPTQTQTLQLHQQAWKLLNLSPLYPFQPKAVLGK